MNQSRSKLGETGGVPTFGEQGVVCDLPYAVRLASQAWESGFVPPGPARFQASMVGQPAAGTTHTSEPCTGGRGNGVKQT